MNQYRPTTWTEYSFRHKVEYDHFKDLIRSTHQYVKSYSPGRGWGMEIKGKRTQDALDADPLLFWEFYGSYIEAMLWTVDDDAPGGEYVVENTRITIHPSRLKSALADCKRFWGGNNVLITEVMTAGEAGHGFLLTRDHHAVGFWDRDLRAAGDTLSSACDAYGDSNEGVEAGLLY